MTVYRAANDDYVSAGFSFAANREDAEAYLDNPGFGGSTLYVAEIDGLILDLTRERDNWEDLSAIVGEIDPFEYGHHFARALTASDSIIAALAEAGYDAVMFTDDFPIDCVTFVPVSERAVEQIEDTICIVE